MKQLSLNDGHQVPVLGFGTYKATEKEGVQAVKAALKNGYRLIDTAAKYENEVAVGKGIAQSPVPREEIIVTTKLWRDYLGYGSTKKELDKSLKKLNLEYIDLYLIHWPANAKNYENWQKTNAETWKAMEELQADGKIKSIGVSNFWPEHFEALFKTANVPPAINQIEYHPGYWQPEVVKYCKERKIALQSWSPLARGRVFDNKLLRQIASSHNKTVSQICLRWIIQANVIAIPKSTHEERIKENMDVFDFELSKKEMKAISELPEMGFSGELPNIWPDRANQSE